MLLSMAFGAAVTRKASKAAEDMFKSPSQLFFGL